MIRPAHVPLAAVAWIDLLNRVIDGIDDLACRGYLVDPDPPHEWANPPGEAITELAGLVAGCSQCRRGPSALGEHWLSLQLGKWQRARPARTCACGTVYKWSGKPGHNQQFYTVTPDGLFGAPAGAIKINSKGRVTHSGACRCGRRLAEMVSRQDARPMQYAAPGKAPGTPEPGPAASHGALFGKDELTRPGGETS